MFLRDTCCCENCQRNSRDKRFAREACFESGDVKVENVIVAFNAEKDEDFLVEEGPQIERGTVTHATVRFITETSVTSGFCVKRVLT